MSSNSDTGRQIKAVEDLEKEYPNFLERYYNATGREYDETSDSLGDAKKKISDFETKKLKYPARKSAAAVDLLEPVGKKEEEAPPTAPATSAAGLLVSPKGAKPQPALIKPIAAIKGGRMQMVDPNEIEYEMPNYQNMFGETGVLTPIGSTIKGARFFIAEKYYNQSLPIKDGEVPLVETLDESTGRSYSRTIGNQVGLKRAPVAGVIKSVSPDSITILDKSNKVHVQHLDHYTPHARKTYSNDTPLVKPGDVVDVDQPLAHSNYVDKEGRLAMGKNLRIAFVPGPNGSTFEDAIAVSERAAKALSSLHMYGFDVEHKNGVESDKAKFVSLFPNKYTNEQLDKFGPDGKPKPGAILNSGDPIALSFRPRALSSKDAALGNLHKVLRNSYEDTTETWHKPTPGIVTDAVKTRKGISVNVSTEMPLREGDKISGRNGAKGVIGKVIPNDKMFRDANGDHVDILINPAAMIGRVNPGMIFEALLGKVATKTGKPYRLPSFTSSNFRDFVEKELQKHGLSDTEDLLDPETGRKVPSVLTGNQWFMKLEHEVSSKISGRGADAEDEGYNMDGQPAKGGPHGAKRLGGLLSLALISHGVPEVLTDAKLRGSKNSELWRRIKSGQPLPAPQVPFIFNKFLATLKGAGINVERKGDKFNIFTMTDRDVEKLAPKAIENDETIDLKTGEPIKGGLFSHEIHGVDGLGWSHIPLDQAMPNPLLEEPIRRMLGLTKDKYRSVIAGKEYINGKTGAQAVVHAMDQIDLDRLEKDSRDMIRSGRKSKRDDAVKMLNFVTGFKRSGLSPKDTIISKIPVIPPSYRPISVMDGMALVADANYLYKDFLDAQRALRINRNDLPDEELADEKLAVYDAIKAIQGLGDPITLENQQRSVKGFIKQIAGSGGPKCYDDETEIYTENGWIPFPEYTDPSVKVATLNPDTKEMEFQNPSGILHEPYSGTMVHTKTTKLDLLVTEGHWHYVEKIIKRAVPNTKKKKRRREVQPAAKVQAGDLAGKTQRVQYVVAADKFTGSTPDYTFGGVTVDKAALAEFVGWWIAEGWINERNEGKYGEIAIAQKTGTDGERDIDDVFDRLNLKVSRNVITRKTASKFCDVGYKTTFWLMWNKELADWLIRNCGSGSHNKKLSDEILGWEQEHQLLLLRAYLRGDGEKRATKNGEGATFKAMSPALFESSRFNTASKKLVDGIERLCLQCGLGFRRYGVIKFDNDKWADQYRCRIYGWNRVMVEYPNQTKRIENWSGNVHCVTVPNGLIFVRRNSKIAVSGNTGIFMSKVVGHPVNNVGRSTIIPNGDLDMDEIGIPEKMAWRMYKPFTMGRMVRDGMAQAEAAKHLEKQTAKAKEYLLKEMEYRPVMYNRDPALHRFAVMGAKPRLITGDSIQISPLVVKPFGADFNGDSVSGYHSVTYKCNGMIRNSSFFDLAESAIGLSIEQIIEDAKTQTLVYPVKPGALQTLGTDGTSMGWKDVSQISVHTSHGQCYRVETHTRKSLVATEHHSFMVLSDDLELKEIKTEVMPVGSFIPAVYNFAADVESLDIETPSGNISLDEDFGWLLGFYAAEGSGGGGAITFCCTEKEYFDKARGLMKKYFGTDNKLQDTHLHKECIFREYRKDLIDWFGTWCGKRFDSKVVPAFMFHAPKTARLAYIQGVIDGDGNVSKSETGTTIRAEMKNRLFIEQLAGLAASIGIRCYTPSTAKAEMIRICNLDNYIVMQGWKGSKADKLQKRLALEKEYYRDVHDVIPFTSSVKASLKVAANKLKRPSKKEREEMMEWRKGYLGKKYSIGDGYSLDAVSRRLAQDIVWTYGFFLKDDPVFQRWMAMVGNRDIQWEKVISCDLTDREDVTFDLTVPDTQTFCTHGNLIVHNSMGVHVPVSDSAVEEVKKKMLPSRNLFSIKSREVHYTPSQEFTLGLWNASSPNRTKQSAMFLSKDEALAAYRRGEIDIDTPVQIAQ